MSTVTLNIVNTGKNAGTCKWVADFLSNCDLRITYKDGDFYIQIGDKTDDETKRRWTTIAKTYNDDMGWQIVVKNGIKMAAIWESDKQTPDPQVPALFGSLTKAAEDYTWQFIELCCKELSDYILNDEKKEFNLKIVQK